MRITPLRSGCIALWLVAMSACSNSEDSSPVNANAGNNARGAIAQGGSNTSVVIDSKGGIENSGVTTNASSGPQATLGTSGGTVPTAIDCRKEGDGMTTLVFVNTCAQAVTYRGSDIAGGTISPGVFACVDIGTSTEALSSKRYWGWTGTDPGAGRHTLAEFTFNTNFYDLDWYNISHVDAHNLPMAILPQARPKCRPLRCPQDFLATCPATGQYRDTTGNLVSCVSPNRDDANNPVVSLFEQCDDAYAWSGDDQNGTDVSPMIGCEVEDFDIVFCPEAT